MERVTTSDFPILVVDDEAQALHSVESALLTGGIANTIACQDSRLVLDLIEQHDVSVVLLDLFMPHLTGEQLLAQLVVEYPHIPTIIVTGSNDIEAAVNCLKMGAYDYIVKPAEKDRLVASVHRALETRNLRIQNRLLSKKLLVPELENSEAFASIVTRSEKMEAMFQYIEAVSKSSQPVLILGETGVGKELVAQAFHQCSRPAGPFVSVNVAGLDEEAFSDTLFGHRKGAFTGADGLRKGMIQRAAGGTLFLDEIGDLSMVSQTKLLRVLQEREYYPLGSDVALTTDARIVVATNQDLEKLIQEGLFRKDLYYRLQTHCINIPPLRERKNDIPLLAEAFLKSAAEDLQKASPTIPPQLNTLLSCYDFPGNVRELKAMFYDAVSSHQSGILSLETFRKKIPVGLPKEKVDGESDTPSKRISFGSQLPTLKQSAELLVAEALQRADSNQTIAARMLGITQQALSKRVQQLRSSND